jgi:ATP dependent DNA ligase domain
MGTKGIKRGTEWNSVLTQVNRQIRETFDSDGDILISRIDVRSAINPRHGLGVVARSGHGFRALALEAKFPAVATAVSKPKLRSTILDGEVVAVDEDGIPRFQLLQRFQKQPTAPTLYYIFDVLWYNGDDLNGWRGVEAIAAKPSQVALAWL